MQNNLNKQEQEILFAEIASIIQSKKNKKLCLLAVAYIKNEDSKVDCLTLSNKNKDRNFVGFQVTMKSIDFIETTDKLSIELENGFTINSSYKAFMQSEFDEQTPSIVYICFFDIDEYRRYCNHKVNEVILRSDKDKKLFIHTIENPREPNEAIKKAYSKRKEIFEQ
jgi:hypothetical protein